MKTKITKELNSLANSERAKNLQSFFKTGKGQYGEGDIFLGIAVPQIRKVAEKFKTADLNTIQNLLNTKIHEQRMLSLIILTHQYKNNSKKVFDFYIKNTNNINNWDLVDVTCPKIVGHYLLNKEKNILYKLAHSKNLWEKRIAIISTAEFIKNNQFQDTLKISKILLNDSHDLIHKAVGWMLREVGKRNQKIEEDFLKKYYKQMPRTMLRYAIEKFPEEKRQKYLKGEI